MPVRGCSSMSRRPRSRSVASAACDVGDLVGDVVQPGAALGQEAPDRRLLARAGAAARRGSRRRRGARPRRPARRRPRDARRPCRRRCSCRAIAASRSSTATPMWSTRANIARLESSRRLVRCFSDAATRRSGSGLRRSRRGTPSMMRSICAALERLVLEQLGGDAVQQLAVGGDEVPRAAVRLEGQLALLLVADAAREVRQRLLLERRLRRVAGAHRVLVDHRVGDLLDALQVAGGAGGHRAEDDLLGDAAAEEDRHLVDELVAGLQVGVLVGQVDHVAQRAAARDDRDLVHAVDAVDQLAAQRVAGLVEGHDAALVRR